MALTVKFEAETGNDHISPLTIADALVQYYGHRPEYVEEIAAHLAAAAKRLNT